MNTFKFAGVDGFPSPCGEKVGINGRTEVATYLYNPDVRFRPLAGKR